MAAVSGSALRGIVRRVVPGRGGEVVVVAEEVARDRDLLVRVFGPEGVPEAGVRVVAGVAGAPAEGATTDADGRAVLRGLPAWPTTVNVQPPVGRDVRPLAARTVEGVVPGTGLVTVRLFEVARLRGRVVDADGKPVAKAWCAALEGAGYVACFPTDEDGRFDAWSNVAAGTRLQVSARFPMENATTRGVVDGAIAGGADLTIVLRRFSR